MLVRYQNAVKILMSFYHLTTRLTLERAMQRESGEWTLPSYRK